MFSVVSILIFGVMELVGCLTIGCLYYAGADVGNEELLAVIIIIFISSVIALVRFWRKEYKRERRQMFRPRYDYVAFEYRLKDSSNKVINSIDDLYD